MPISRSERFLEHLFKEKELHKEHRHKHVIYKLILTGSFFGLGQFNNVSNTFHLFLYVVPIIALVHDTYIFAEDFKVKRVGFFFRKLKKKFPTSPICREEIFWEKDYLNNHREKWAYIASLFYTIIITLFSAVAVYKFDFREYESRQIYLYLLWLLFCACLIVLVFFYAKALKKKIIQIEIELSQ